MAKQNEPVVVCSVETFLGMVSNKWKIEIIWHLLKGKQRFGELRRNVIGINQKVLTDNLRAMEKDELIKRTVYAEIPPRVEYELTSLGESLRKVLGSIGDWGMWYLRERNPDKQFLDCRSVDPEVRKEQRLQRL